ncbi:universal stress protein [Pseudonocardia asaccharolytica]|uniref:UspA domain-containing protein n=1 Tax=Pseudonocardia asaccharolytica DSM 44247 = NBRC 16224 TaxID=1123024 RepID=A0A511D6H2_9PSEU|nr:universal stress protein [Pseudonocardia asaccharolytica]GEL20372.1 hypothetical protein PA7_42090 [Pseudonocardia asaccharolytica DSM 44247 = NBRC 16224]
MHPSAILEQQHLGSVVVLNGAEIPGWVERWCAAAGRELVLRSPAARSATFTEPAVAQRARLIAELAGHTVLVAHPAPAATGRPQVVAAVRELPDDAQVLADAADAAAHLGAVLHLVHGVPQSFAERSVGLDAAVERGRRVLAAGIDALRAHAPGATVTAELARAHPHELVGEDLDAQLLVIGGPRIRRPRMLGLVARSALAHAPCPVLFVPRPG